MNRGVFHYESAAWSSCLHSLFFFYLINQVLASHQIHFNIYSFFNHTYWTPEISFPCPTYLIRQPKHNLVQLQDASQAFFSLAPYTSSHHWLLAHQLLVQSPLLKSQIQNLQKLRDTFSLDCVVEIFKHRKPEGTLQIHGLSLSHCQL